MNEKFEIQKISSTCKFITLSNSQKIELPSWIKNRYSSMQYLTTDKILQINCYKCKRWFDIAKLNENNEWINIQNNLDIKLNKSGFSSYCQLCSLDHKEIEYSGKSPIINSSAITVSKMERDTAFLTPENLQYIKLRLALDNSIRKADFYNYLVQQEKEKNPISKFL